MTRGSVRRCRISILSILTAFVAGAIAAEIVYLQTLRLPALGDDISYPKAVTADLHTGEIFICDSRGNRILIFDEQGLFEYQINGGSVFRAPRDVGIDPEGFLVVLANHQLRRTILNLDFDGLFLGEVELQGIPPEAETPYLISLALSKKGDRVYLLDQRNVKVWIADRQGKIVGSIDLDAGMTEIERRDALLGHVDVSDDKVLVPFPRVGKVRAWNLDGKFVGETGAPGGTRCKLSFPVAAAIDATGNYLIVDSQRMVFSTWDPREDECLGDHFGFGIAPGFLYFPTDLALDGNGRIYISQPLEGRVQVYQGEAAAAGTKEN